MLLPLTGVAGGAAHVLPAHLRAGMQSGLPGPPTHHTAGISLRKPWRSCSLLSGLMVHICHGHWGRISLWRAVRTLLLLTGHCQEGRRRKICRSDPCNLRVLLTAEPLQDMKVNIGCSPGERKSSVYFYFYLLALQRLQ